MIEGGGPAGEPRPADAGRADVRSAVHRYGSGSDTGRLLAFSDGVFAIAITLLVLDLKVPEAIPHGGLFTLLGEEWPHFTAFIISFAVIGILWIAHHSTFAYIERYDRRLLWMNLLVLLCVAFMPYSTAVLAEFAPTSETVSFYAAVLVVTMGAQLLLWRYATAGHRLVRADLDAGLIRYATLRGVLGMAVFGGSIAVAQISPIGGQLCWLLLFPGYWLLQHVCQRQAEEADAREFGPRE